MNPETIYLDVAVLVDIPIGTTREEAVQMLTERVDVSTRGLWPKLNVREVAVRESPKEPT